MRPEPPNVLETTRVRGGLSARLAAVAIALVLGLVAWIGMSGPSATIAPASRAPDVAQLSNATPEATAEAVATAQPLTSPVPTPPSTAPTAEASIERDDLSIVAKIGRRQFLTWLRPVKHGHLSGSFRMPFPPPATEGTLELEQVWRTVEQAWKKPSHDAWATLATWDLHLESLSAASEREYVVLDRIVPARPTVEDLSMLVTRGYRITVRAHSGVPHGVVTVDVEMAAGRRLEGNDGIFGWPVVAQLALPLAEIPSVVNGCHWNGRPPPSRRPPWPTYDETSC